MNLDGQMFFFLPISSVTHLFMGQDGKRGRLKSHILHDDELVPPTVNKEFALPCSYCTPLKYNLGHNDGIKKKKKKNI